MILLLVLLAIVCLWRIQISGYHADYLSKESTTAIKGIFAALIFCSHIRGYITLSPAWWNTSYNTILDHLGQLTVVLFFFYSGYGIWESQKRKGDYGKTFFKRRFLKILLHFDIAVLIFIVVQLLIPIHYSVRQYALCWVGWASVGNSNWFIFDILALYLIAQVALWVQNRWGQGGIPLTLGATVALWIALRFAGKPAWWMDTILAFPLGMVVSSYKKELDGILSKPTVPYLMTGVFLMLLLLAHKFTGNDIYGLTACLFCCFVTLAASLVTLGNPVLAWLGKNAFTIYIIQRLPMIVFSAMGLNQHTPLFVLLCLAVTLLLSEGLSRLYTIVDNQLLSS